MTYKDNIFEYQSISDLFHSFTPYNTDNIYSQFFFFLVLYACCSILGLLMGSFVYCLKKKFNVIFWFLFFAMITSYCL